MAISSIATRTSSLTTNVGIIQWRNGATGRVKTMEVALIQSAGTIQSFGWGVPAALASTPTDVTFLRDDPADPASLVISSITWTTGPSAPTTYKRRANTPATAGTGIIWTVPRGIVMAISTANTIHGISTMIANDVHIVVEE